MLDASGGYMKDGNKNRLRAMDIHQIVDVFNKQLDIPKYSRMVGFAEIENNDFNLNLPRYIDSSEPEDLQDIASHLLGGIPAADVDALQRYWSVCPNLKAALFTVNRPGYLDLSVNKSAIKTSIYQHPEFADFMAGMNAHFSLWRDKWAGNAEPQLGKLKQLSPGFHPKSLIVELSEDLLAHYAGKALIDKYHVYQHLMDYWAETMQDDCYLIAADGWQAETSRIIEIDKKGKEKDKGWTCDLLPKPLIVARYFAAEQQAIEQLQAELNNVSAQLSELEEEHSGEDAVFFGFDKINKAEVSSRIKEIGTAEPQLGRQGNGYSAELGLVAPDEITVLKIWLKLSADEAALKKQLKDAEAELDAKAYVHYPKLSEAEIKTLVVDDKWLATLDAAIHGEMDRISQQLTQRVKQLAERYETPVPQINQRVLELEAKVNGHLQKMGFAWH